MFTIKKNLSVYCKKFPGKSFDGSYDYSFHSGVLIDVSSID